MSQRTADALTEMFEWVEHYFGHGPDVPQGSAALILRIRGSWKAAQLAEIFWRLDRMYWIAYLLEGQQPRPEIEFRPRAENAPVNDDVLEVRLLEAISAVSGGLAVRLLRYGSDGDLSFLGDLNPVNSVAKIAGEVRKGVRDWRQADSRNVEAEYEHSRLITEEEHRHIEDIARLRIEDEKVKLEVLKVILPSLSEEDRRRFANRLMERMIEDTVALTENPRIEEIRALPPAGSDPGQST